MDKPKPPIGRLIFQADGNGTIQFGRMCSLCGSSLKRKLLFFKSKKCIQPKCNNYFGKKEGKK